MKIPLKELNTSPLNTSAPEDKEDEEEKDGEVLCAAWQDNITVMFQTTAHSSADFDREFHLDTIKRLGILTVRKEASYLSISQSYKDYNMHMGGG